MNPATAASLPSSDLELVERHRYGDTEAFEEVYARYERLVYNLALRMTANTEDAADLTQDAFLRIYRSLESFRGSSSLKTWVFRVALNCCRSRLRRRRFRDRFRQPEPVEGYLERVADPGRGPEEKALAHDLGGHLAECLARVPLPFREAVVLRDLQGMTYEEIAIVLEVRIGTVRSRIARGRERLRVVVETEK